MGVWVPFFGVLGRKKSRAALLEGSFETNPNGGFTPIRGAMGRLWPLFLVTAPDGRVFRHCYALNMGLGLYESCFCGMTFNRSAVCN